MNKKIQLSGKVLPEQYGKRLDQVLAEMFPEFSRSRLKEFILANKVLVNGEVFATPKLKLFGGEDIDVDAELQPEVAHKAEKIELDIVFEDDSILVINKPAGLVVHPGAGNQQGTLLNALLHHSPEIELVPRAGIVHRLDKETTGLMVVAKTIEAQTRLVDDLQNRDITREYEAVACGVLTAGGSVDAPIGRHPSKRTHMAINPAGKEAVTHYRVAEKFREHTRLRLRLESGRTHQIRVHMAHISHPLLGDPTYGGRPKLPKQSSAVFIKVLRAFKRQALHATMLSLAHPLTGEIMEWNVVAPDDMQELYKAMREDFSANKDLVDDY